VAPLPFMVAVLTSSSSRRDVRLARWY